MKRCIDLEARKYETEYLAASLITSQIWNAKLRDDPYYFYPHFLSFRFRKTKTDGLYPFKRQLYKMVKHTQTIRQL